MRRLFDENLSESLLPALADLFPNSLHVRTLGSAGATDRVVWDLARQHGCLLVTRDEDFIRLSVARGAPPKVIWIALGNCSIAAVVALLRNHHRDLARFREHEEATFLALGSDASAG